ncbi:MAG: regulatory protein RecX [Acidobacteriota bacterium]
MTVAEGDVPSVFRPVKSSKESHCLALRDALRILGRKSCSMLRLRQKLEGRGHHRTEIQIAIRKLERLGLLDDKQFAREHFRIGSELKLRGKNRLIREAHGLGVPRPVISEVLEEHTRNIGERGILLRALRKWVRLHGAAEDLRAKGRLYQHLLRKGFESELIQEAMRSSVPGGEGESG